MIYKKILEFISKNKILTGIYIFLVHFAYYPSELSKDSQLNSQLNYKKRLREIKNYHDHSRKIENKI